MSDQAPAYRPRCRNLCCKSMLVFGESFENDPDYQAGMVEFWCIRTSKGQGPDGGDVKLAMCSDPARGCYQEY